MPARIPDFSCMRSSRQQHGERLVADVVAGRADGVAEPQRLALADVVDVGQVGDGPDLLELLELAGPFEVGLQLEGAVEVVLDGPLVATGDDEDVGDAARHRLLDHVLDGRLVHQGQHLLGLGLGGREEAGPEAGGGDDGFLDGERHGPPFYQPAVSSRLSNRPLRVPDGEMGCRPTNTPASRAGNTSK